MLFCISANYTPKALDPNNYRRETVEKLVITGGGKLVAKYDTLAEGPGAMVIFEADPAVAPAIDAVAASSDGVSNVKMQRLLSGDEVRAIQAKWTLVLLWVGGNTMTASSVPHFESKEACERAFNALKSDVSWGSTLIGMCVSAK